MSAIYLRDGALRPLEILSGRDDSRVFKVPGSDYYMEIIKGRDAGSHTHPRAAAEVPGYDECAAVIAQFFAVLLGKEADARRDATSTAYGGTPKPLDVSEREQGPPPDFEKGWEVYRAHLAETSAVRVPAWKELSLEVQESFCAGCCTAIEPIPNIERRTSNTEYPSETFPIKEYEVTPILDENGKGTGRYLIVGGGK